MALSQVINTDKFTQEELAIIQDVLDRGQVEHLMKLFPDVDLSPEKELEITKLKGFYSHSTPGYSDEEIKKKWKKIEIETPEQEAAMQADLNAHKHAWMLSHGYKPSVPFVLPVVETKKVDNVKEEPNTEVPKVESKKGATGKGKRGRPAKVVVE